MTVPHSPTPRPGCLELETVAAFADRRLSGAERDAVVAHLADCDDCRELVVEAAALAAEAAPGAATRAGEIVRFPEPKRRALSKLAVATAALALAVVGAIAVVQLTRPSAEETLARLGQSEGAAERLGADWSQALWSVTRGDGPTVSEGARAFRIGVRSAGLELALHLGDRRTAERLAAESAQLLAEVPLADPVAQAYRDIARRLGEGTAKVAGLADEAAAGWRLSREAVDPALFDLGRWSEAGRLATAAGARAALPRRPNLPADLPAELRELAEDASSTTPAPELAAIFARLVAGGGGLQ